MSDKTHSQIGAISLKLPQPCNNNDEHGRAAASRDSRYIYLPYDEIHKAYFRAACDTHKDEKEEDNYGSCGIPEETLVWVMKSKGWYPSNKNAVFGEESSRNRKTPELFSRARVVSSTFINDDGEDFEERDGCRGDKRLLVRYPKGSTYRVRMSNLAPVLEAGVISDRIVIVTPETPEYRRAATIHTCVGESFLEIGCDFGPCVDRVRTVLTKSSDVPRYSSINISKEIDDGDDNGNCDQTGNENEDGRKRVCCIGIDKSPASLDVAKERYPNTFFSLEDALTDEGSYKLRKLCKDKLIGGEGPSVVGIDINGNRNLPDVLECIRQVMQPSKDVTLGKDWFLPRLIIVKSRFLYNTIKKHRPDGVYR